MNRSIENTRDFEPLYYEPEVKGGSRLFSWITSLFKKKVVEQYAEQSAALSLLEKRFTSWNKSVRHAALGALYGIDVKAYDKMALTPEHRAQLKERVEELQDIYRVYEDGTNYADIAAARAYEVSTVNYIQELVRDSQSTNRRTAAKAREALFSLEVTSEQSPKSLNEYLVEELTIAQEAISALIESEKRLAARLEQERLRLDHEDRLTDGGAINLATELQVTKWTLSIPFSRPLFEETNAFVLVEELAELGPGEAMDRIEKHKDEIIEAGAGKELEKVIEQMGGPNRG